jgi:cytochrome c-type biogenesis protein CcsB|uniref:Cytochrome c biogenesis protein CcsA n=1 Tax=Trebouxiophyceae sp. MX-AZ01 TaxID=1208065 RepID=J7K8I4_9CHLO|nr:heme attachment to plastid cytochrome c [Trebouxiophyceae sp. MX-AZ01]AFQ93799.1 heme attachment to plastid cytochrome c [Trebouxiophyceae sp. MX-AZ01]
MIPFELEQALSNLSFVCLLTLVVWYWVKLAFSLGSPLQSVGAIGMGIANLSLAGVLIARWVTSNHFPLSNLYESLLFLAWGLTAFHLVVTRVSRADLIGVVTSPVALLVSGFANFSLPREMQRATALVPALQSNWLMMHVTVMMLSYVALISGSLLSIGFLVINWYDSKRSKGVFTTNANANANPSSGGEATCCHDATPGSSLSWRQPLTVGLQASTASYADALGGARELGSEGSWLIPARDQAPSGGDGEGCHGTNASRRRWRVGPEGVQEVSKTPLSANLDSSDDESGPPPEMAGEVSGLAQTLDNLSYRTLGLGFPLLTIGILSGAVWANEAWGSFWSWDPKETWALITWLVFAIYLHTRLNRGWQGNKPALIAATGFVTVWICYLGVNMLGTGLHSYGWFQNTPG